MDHHLQLLAGDALFVAGFFVDERGLFHHVAGAEKQQAFARQSVASGASGFLIVALHVLRQIVVQDKAHVRLIDAHAEGDGRADDVDFIAQEKLLIF